jgi:predicted  nucleic acid-binding Zn-ribbon protein
MQEPLKSLVDLARLNDRIAVLRKDCEALQIDVRRQQETVSALEQRLEEHKARVLDLRKQADSREVKIKGLEEDIKRFQTQLYGVGDQREYDAMKQQIKDKETGISQLEDEELEELTQIDEVKALMKDIEAQIAEERGRLEAIRAEVDGQTKKYEEELAGLERERVEVRANIDPPILASYERLVAGKGNALVAVRNRICQGCHTLVPMQIWSEVMQEDRIVYCHSCGRMIYYEPD